MTRLVRALTLLGLAASAVTPFAAAAQNYPTRPITMVVGFPPGGAGDAVARLFQEPLSRLLGQQIVIDNRAGAGGTVAAAYVAKAEPDGYTLLQTINASLTMNMYLQKSFPLDSRKAFAPIAPTSDVVLTLVVNSSLPVHNVAELVEYARKNPGKLSYGSAGVGSGHHICGEMLKQKTGIDMVHVPYRGGGPAIQDLVAGTIQVSFGTLPTVMPHVQSGTLRLIAMAENKRHPDFPDLPTIHETIPGVFNIGWSGVLAPAGTPQPIIDKWHAALTTTIRMPEVTARMKVQGFFPMSATPAEFARLVSDEIDYWGKVIPAIGIQPE